MPVRCLRTCIFRTQIDQDVQVARIGERREKKDKNDARNDAKHLSTSAIFFPSFALRLRKIFQILT